MILFLFIRSIINRMMNFAVNILHLIIIIKIEDMKNIMYSQFYKQFQSIKLQIHLFCNSTDFSALQIQLLIKFHNLYIMQVQSYQIIFFINLHNMLLIIIFFLINLCLHKQFFCKSIIIS